MYLKFFALLCLAVLQSLPASLGQVTFGGENGGITVGGKQVTCPDNQFGNISGSKCLCKDGSACLPIDDAAPKATPSPSSPKPTTTTTSSPKPATTTSSPKPTTTTSSPEPATTTTTTPSSATQVSLAGVAVVAAFGLVL